MRYRPGYPPGLLDLLRTKCGLTSSSVIADVGSGTGILAEMFLKNGNTVYGIEPNKEMRDAGERLLANHSNLRSIAATAESTTLADQSVDFVTAGQAFHWFDRNRAKTEFGRILKQPGSVVLIWNDRHTDSTPFLREYEALLRRFGTDYAAVDHKNINDAALGSFFAPGGFHSATLANGQDFDLEALRGRLFSSSYTPEEGHPNYLPMLDELARIFADHQVNGTVQFEYDTKVYYG